MRKSESKSKKMLIASLVLSLGAVLTCSISTLAWFQLDSQAPEFENTSAKPNLKIDNSNVTGYKIQPSLGLDGFPDYSSNSVSFKKGESYDTTNNNQASADTNFDVPGAGLGYYLIKKNPGKTYKYNYTGGTYSWKFAEFNNESVNYLKINASTIGTINSTDRFIVREYSYNSNNYKTINQKVAVVEDTGGVSVDTTTYEITPPSTGDFNIWFNSSSSKISFENIFSLQSINQKRNNISKGGMRQTYTTTTLSRPHTIWLDYSQYNWFDPYVSYRIGSTWTHKLKPSDLSGANNTTTHVAYWVIPANVNQLIFSHTNGWPGNDCQTPDINIEYDADAGGSSACAYNYFTFNNRDSYLYGAWSYNTGMSYTIIYNKNNGTGSISNQTVWLDNATLNNGSSFSRNGYTLDSWNTEANGSGTTYSLGRTATYSNALTMQNGASVTLYAKWKQNNSTTRKTFYVYDNQSPEQSGAGIATIGRGQNWSTLYCYAYGSSLYPENNTYPGKTGSSDSYVRTSSATTNYTDAAGVSKSFKIWTVEVSESFPNIILNNGSSGGTNQSIDITGWQNHIGEYFVLSGTSGGNVSGMWYTSVSAPTSTSTYHVFDKDNTLTRNSGTATIHAWKYNVSGVSATSSTAASSPFYVNWTTEWNTVRLGTPSNLIYTKSIPSIYDSFVLSNGKATRTTSGAFQTQDLSGSNGLSGHEGWYFVLKGNQSTTTEGIATVPGEWREELESTILYVSFHVQTGNSSYYEFDTEKRPLFQITADYTYGGEYLIPSITSKSSINGGNDFTYGDAEYGIVYHFVVPSPSNGAFTWYKDEACTQELNLGEEDPGGSLYIKAVCDIRNYVSIYVDDTAWNNENLAVKTSGNDSTYFTATSVSNWKVATGLYRITLRNDWIIQLSSGSHTDYNLGSNDGGVPNMGSGTAAYYRHNTTQDHEVTYTYLKIGGAGAGTSWTWVDFKSTSASNVYIQRYENSDWTDIAQLLQGDGTGNDYIYESGVQLKNGDIIRIYDKTNSYSYGYDDYVTPLRDTHKYVGGSGHTVTISNLGASDTSARFNFYITHNDSYSSRKLSIAMVPDYGNGYYIMEYNATYGTDNYIGCIKMDSTDYSASYEGYYCSDTSKKIFIRSYINAVDTLCTSLTSNSLSYVKALDGNYCIEFKETGHYNIRVTGSIIDISRYQVSDFFSLNRLDSSLLTAGTDNQKQQEIWRQKTAIVMEIPFVANNPYNATVNLITECSASYIGVRFYVSNHKISESSIEATDPYTYLHGSTNSSYTSSYLTAANTGQIADTNNLSISANTSSTYYAYILIDYMYTVTPANLQSASIPELKFYLQVRQS